MKRIPFVPSPIALLSGALLYGLLVGLGAVAAMVVPQLLELMRTSPRLAMIGFLALVISPAMVVVVAHHFGHRSLDGISNKKTKRILPSTESWWAGAHAWLVLYGTSVLTSLVLLIINPPEPEPDVFGVMVSALAKYTTLANVASLHTVVWVTIAAQLYELERRARKRTTEV